MVANIRSGATPGGTLYYNKEKVDRDEAETLHAGVDIRSTNTGEWMSTPAWRVSCRTSKPTDG